MCLIKSRDRTGKDKKKLKRSYLSRNVAILATAVYNNCIVWFYYASAGVFMPTRDYSEEVDLSKFPIVVDAEPRSERQVTIGDLHGNFIKFLYFLLKEGVINISEVDYCALYKIYNTEKEKLKKKDLTDFKLLLATMVKNDSAPKVRLLGDELCDRGRNDYFTLKLIEKLNALKCDFEILLSNHSAVFICGFEMHFDKKPESIVDFKREHLKKDSRSMQGLQYLLKNKLVELSEVENIYKVEYKKKIKAVSYCFEKETDTLTIYSHAPIDINGIYKLAYDFAISDEESPPTIIDKQAVMELIDRINKKLDSYLKEERLYKHHAQHLDIAIENRYYPHLAPGNSMLLYVHGHDSQEKDSSQKTYRKTLDNELGKHDNFLEFYEVQRYAQESVAPQLVPIASEVPVAPQPFPISSGPVVREKSTTEITQKSARFFSSKNHSDFLIAKKQGARTSSERIRDEPDHGDNSSDSDGRKKLTKPQ